MAFKKENDRKEDARDTCIKRLSCGIGLFLVFYLWNYAFLHCQPLSILMFILVPIGAIYASAKGTPTILKVIIGALFLGIGIYTVFHNDIDGPLIFSIIDRPIDRPSQWFHCCRFYWVGMIIHMTVSNASLLSLLLLGGYKVFKKLST